MEREEKLRRLKKIISEVHPKRKEVNESLKICIIADAEDSCDFIQKNPDVIFLDEEDVDSIQFSDEFEWEKIYSLGELIDVIEDIYCSPNEDDQDEEVIIAPFFYPDRD